MSCFGLLMIKGGTPCCILNRLWPEDHRPKRLLRLPRSVDWGGDEPVDLIFVLALNFSDIENTKAFFHAGRF